MVPIHISIVPQCHHCQDIWEAHASANLKVSVPMKTYKTLHKLIFIMLANNAMNKISQSIKLHTRLLMHLWHHIYP